MPPRRREQRHGGVLKPSIDINLPPTTDMSMRKWIRKWDELGNSDDIVGRDIFALMGHFDDKSDPDNVRRARAAFDTTPCELNDRMQLSLLCDIDSVIGIVMRNFPLSDAATFKYFMLPDVRFTLSSSLHIPGVHVLNSDDERPVAIHTIPNARFAQIGDFLVRIFLPGLRDEPDRRQTGQANYIGERYLQLLYDLAVRPATTKTLPEELRRQWPAEYSSETFRAATVRRNTEAELEEDGGRRGRGGPAHQQQSGREIHGHLVNPWINEIRRRVTDNHELTFAQGFFFVVEGKGFKYITGSCHQTPDGPLADEDGVLYDEQDERTTAIMTLLKDFKPNEFEPGKWFIDIATSVSARNGDGNPVSLFTNRQYHPEIISHFTGIPVARCVRSVETNSGGYTNDEEAHLGNFAGLRMSLDEPGDNDIYYLQVYTSNKSLTYHLQGQSKAKHTSPQRILEDWPAELDGYFIPFANALAAASHTHSVAVRFESRIEFFSYPFVHLVMPWSTMKPWFFHMRNTQYWGFKFRRLSSICSVLGRICDKQARAQLTSDGLPEVGSLLILLTWMSNALVKRPNDGSHWDEVRDSGCVHTNRDGAVVPTRPLSIFYLHSLHLTTVETQLPRLSSQRTISRETIVYLCGSSKQRRTELEVMRLFRGRPENATVAQPTGDAWDNSDSPETALAGGPRKANKQQRVTISLLNDVDDMFGDQLPQRQQIVRYDSEEEDPEVREAETPLSQRVTDIVATFPVQVFAKVPNRKQGGSWCMLDETDRYEIKSHIFSNKDMPRRIFTSYIDCGRDKERWDNTVRAWFPTCAEKQQYAKVQGLKQLAVWQDWEELLLNSPPHVAADIVTAARKYVNDEWRWLPWMAKNHLWATGTTSSGIRMGNANESGGPWIIFNPRLR